MPADDDLAAAVAAVADELAVRGVLARLSQLADGGAVEDYLALVADDVRWSAGGREHRGRDAVAAEVAAYRGRPGRPGAERHLLTTVTVDVAGDRATARSHWVLVRRWDGPPEVALVGTYDDELVRTAAGWELSARTVTAD